MQKFWIGSNRWGRALVSMWIGVLASCDAPEDDFEDESEQRVWNGQPASKGEYPFMASLHLRQGAEVSRAFCGGALIRDRWIVTAAHCVQAYLDDYSAQQLRVGVGRVDQDKYDVSNTKTAVGAWIHPNYDEASGINDVAVIKLASKVSKPKGKLATAADDGLESAGEFAWAMGFGLSKQDGESTAYSTARRLQEVKLKITAKSVCKDRWKGTPTKINKRVLCARRGPHDIQHGHVACAGDSGSPLVHKNGGDPKILGITSRGKCRLKKNGELAVDTSVPSTFTRASKVRPWVMKCSGGGQGDCGGANLLAQN